MDIRILNPHGLLDALSLLLSASPETTLVFSEDGVTCMHVDLCFALRARLNACAFDGLPTAPVRVRAASDAWRRVFNESVAAQNPVLRINEDTMVLSFNLNDLLQVSRHSGPSGEWGTPCLHHDHDPPSSWLTATAVLLSMTWM